MNSEKEREAFRKFMVSKYSWPDDDEFWEVDAKGKFIDDEFEDTFALFRDARAALTEHEGMTIAGGEETLAELGALIKDGHKNRGGPQGHA